MALLLPLRSAAAGTRTELLTPRAAAGRDIAAVAPGIAPFGMVVGVAAGATGPLAALVGAGAVYGGSAQLTTMTLLDAGAGLVAAVASGIVVNLRLTLYGAALADRFRDQPSWFRWLAPQFLIDQTYLATLRRPQYDGARFRQYWAWLTGLLLVVWTGSIAVGLLLGPALPALPHLGLAGAALFVGLLVPRLVDRTAVVSAATAAAVALAVDAVAPEVSVLAGTAAGVAAAVARSRS